MRDETRPGMPYSLLASLVAHSGATKQIKHGTNKNMIKKDTVDLGSTAVT